jgi:FtsZ-interacting cell division protein ZipA
VATGDRDPLSTSTTSTSIDVIDTSTDNISNSPKAKAKTRPFSPIIEGEDSNQFIEGFKELAISERAKRSNPEQATKTAEEEEEDDQYDEEAFKQRREHFQKTKSRSEHKSIILNVSTLFRFPSCLTNKSL